MPSKGVTEHNGTDSAALMLLLQRFDVSVKDVRQQGQAAEWTVAVGVLGWTVAVGVLGWTVAVGVLGWTVGAGMDWV